MLPLLDELGINKRVIDVFSGKSGKRYNRTFTVFSEPLPHNVPNCGYKIIYGRERLFYATDTSSLTTVEAPNYDLYLIEGNYSKDEIKERIRQKKAVGEYAYEIDAEYNHLSKEDAFEWLAKNAGTHSKYVFMHEHAERGDKQNG